MKRQSMYINVFGFFFILLLFFIDSFKYFSIFYPYLVYLFLNVTLVAIIFFHLYRVLCGCRGCSCLCLNETFKIKYSFNIYICRYSIMSSFVYLNVHVFTCVYSGTVAQTHNSVKYWQIGEILLGPLPPAQTNRIMQERIITAPVKQ